jgi:hypothetical protein
MAESKDRRATPADLVAARAALAEGDSLAARELARRVLADPAAGPAAHDEARGIDRATRIDPSALLAGAVVFGVLVLLFWYVLAHARSAP